MFLIDVDVLVKQLIPPHWREPKKLTIFSILTEPLKTVYKSSKQLLNDSKLEINLNSQVIVLENYINRILDYGRTSIVDNARGFTIRVSDIYVNRELDIIRAVNPLKLAGISFTIQFFKE